MLRRRAFNIIMLGKQLLVYFSYVARSTWQRIILRLADALIVMDSRLVIRVENTCMVTTSSLEVLGAGLNGTMSNCLRLVLLILLPLLLVA